MINITRFSGEFIFNSGFCDFVIVNTTPRYVLLMFSLIRMKWQILKIGLYLISIEQGNEFLELQRFTRISTVFVFTYKLIFHAKNDSFDLEYTSYGALDIKFADN